MERLATMETRWCLETSGLTGESTDSVQEKETSTLVTDLTVTEWTNEKHCQYLESMEASFVNQLYSSMDLLGCHSQRDNSSCRTHVDTHSSSDQFKVQRRGCWQKIDFGKVEPQFKEAKECHTLLSNPWIRHFRSASKDQVVAPPTRQSNATSRREKIQLRGNKELLGELAPKSKQFPSWHTHLYHHNSVGSSKEVSDQNFADEDGKGGMVGSTGSSKRIKTLVTDESRKDQVVPSGIVNHPKNQVS